MRIFKQLLPLIAGFALFLCFNALMNYLIIPNQFTRVKIHRIETGTYEDLILGSSHGNAAINPAVLAEKTGRSGYNAAAGGQCPVDNYYLLKDALREHDVKRVILEYDPSYWLFHDSFNGTARYQLSQMAPSTVRLAYFAELCLPGDLRYVFLPWTLYDVYPERMKANLEKKKSGAYLNYETTPFTDDTQTFHEDGFMELKDFAVGNMSTPELSFDGKMSYVEENRTWFERIIKLCLNKGMEVIVVTTPVPGETLKKNAAFYAEAHAMMEALLAPYGVRYLDFAAPKETDETAPCAGRWDGGDFSDGEGHMRGSAAGDFSHVLAELL